MHQNNAQWIMLAGLVALSAPSAVEAKAPRPKKKQKMSLAEIAALEWKLEQASTELVNGRSPTARASALEQLAKISDPRVIAPLSRSLQEDPSAQVRTRALALLSPFKTPQVKGLLALAAAADPDAAVRAAATAALKRFPRAMRPSTLSLTPRPFAAPKSPNAQSLVQMMSLAHGEARLWALAELAKQGYPRLDKLLRGALQGDPAARVRARAAQLLGARSKSPHPALLAATTDGDARVRLAIASELARYGAPRALAALQAMVRAEQNAATRRELEELLEPATAVGRLLLGQRIARLRSNEVSERTAALDALSALRHWRAMVPMACTLLRDPSAAVRAHASTRLTHLHDSSVLTALRTAAVIERDPKLRSRLRKLLVGLRKRVDGLVSQLAAAEPAARAQAAQLLGQAAYPQGLKPLLALAASDANLRVRRSAVKALTNYSAAPANALLAKAAGDPDPEIRRIASGHRKSEAAFEGWRRFYQDTNRMIVKTTDPSGIWRRDAALALGVRGAERAAYRLIHLLAKDPDEEVRLAAAWSLVLMASEKAEQALKRAAAKDASKRVRLAARRFLVIDKVSVDELRQQLASGEDAVRADAAEALSLRTAGATRYDLVSAAMCDRNPIVRASALRGLARLGDGLARVVLRSTLHRDPDATVRRSALVMYILAGGK